MHRRSWLNQLLQCHLVLCTKGERSWQRAYHPLEVGLAWTTEQGLAFGTVEDGHWIPAAGTSKIRTHSVHMLSPIDGHPTKPSIYSSTRWRVGTSPRGHSRAWDWWLGLVRDVPFAFVELEAIRLGALYISKGHVVLTKVE